MPFTFLAHQAPVLPVKRAAPRWFSGTGLVLGSIAPDLGYFVIGFSVSRDWHRIAGVFLYCLPTSLALHVIVTRLLAEPVARQLPRGTPTWLREFGWVAAQPRGLAHWGVVAWSVIVGAGTHLAWDLFTHAGSWMGEYVPVLRATFGHWKGRPVVGSSIAWTVSTVGGAAVSLVVLRAIARAGEMRRWAEAREPGSTAGIDPYAPPASRFFWSIVVVAFVAGLVAGWLTRPSGFDYPAREFWAVLFVRSTASAFVGLCLASALERRAWRRSRGRRHGVAPRQRVSQDSAA